MKRLKTLLLFVILVSMITISNAQIISQFDFNSNPVTNATVGPNATSISTSATSSPGGVGGTNGLNPGLPKMDIEMVVPGSPTFDVNGIDVSFYYQRDESVGEFFERGQSLRIEGTNNLVVRYRIDDGGGGYNTVNSGNIYAIPNDNVMRHYRFIYTPCDGVGMVLVNNTLVWMNDGPDNRNMYWVGSGDVVIGGRMDGSGSNQTALDQFVVGAVDCSPLPVEFVEVAVNSASNDYAQVNWSTASERNNSHFIVEKMISNNDWYEIGTVQGAGYSVEELNYSFIDLELTSGLSYYRIKQVDFDEEYSYSDIVSLDYNFEEFKVYPNPSEGLFNVFWNKKELNKNNQIEIYNLQGRLVRSFDVANNSSTTIDLSDVDAGCYILRFGNQKLTLLKE